MNTTTSTQIEAADGIGGRFARNLRTIVRVDAVVTIIAGLEMLAMPALLIDLLGLGSTPVWALRLLGFEWLIFGLWLLTLWNAPLTRGKAMFSISVLGLNALFILLAPLVFSLGFSALGWAVTLGTIVFMDLVCLAWWQVIAGRAGTEG